MPLPNFLIIGAGKAGTTSLYHYLRQHPQIFMSRIKETNFFAFDGQRDTERFSIRTLDAYTALFSAAAGERALGEASPSYLVYAAAVGRIRQRLPGVKLFAQLRDPSERAYAHYLDNLDRGQERRDFASIIREYRAGVDPTAGDPGYMYLATGFYHRHLTRFLERFPRDQLLIGFYDDFKRDPMAVLRQIFRFLQVAENFSPDVSKRHNPSGLPRSSMLHTVTRERSLSRATKGLPEPVRRSVMAVGRAIRQRNFIKPDLPVETRRELIAVYRDDVSALQDLTERDLASWLV
jgi:hypothetical protein